MKRRIRTVQPATRRAATLAELLLVVAIAGVLAGLAVPRYARAVERRRFNSAALRLQADVALAREASRAASAGRTLRFSTADDTYWIVGTNLLSADAGAAVALGQQPYGVDLTYADFGGVPDLVFDGHGRVVSGGEVHFRIGDMRGRLVFSDGAMRSGDTADADPTAGIIVEVDVGGVLSDTGKLLGL
ncbi:MAG: Tfp pilus assembly protein FimT/FimU [Phycisphaerales bacterium JB039]